MNKLLFALLFFFCSNIGAQDSLAVAKKEKIIFTEKDILIDTTVIEAKTFGNNFKNKYKDQAFIYEFKTPEKNAWDRFKEWLASILQRLFKFSSENSSMNLVENTLKIIALLIVLIVAYMIVKAIMNKEGQWIFGKNSDRKIINYSEVEKNLHLVNFEKLIQSALDSNDYRLTIRYYYLWLLKKMSDKQIIEWDVEKTNTDYTYEIKNEELKNDFAYLSYLYNNIWYGEFTVDEAVFTKATNAFEQLIAKVNNE